MVTFKKFLISLLVIRSLSIFKQGSLNLKFQFVVSFTIEEVYIVIILFHFLSFFIVYTKSTNKLCPKKIRINIF